MSPKIVEAIKALDPDRGESVKHLLERFSPNTPDPDWISALAQEGDWVVISSDVRITQPGGAQSVA